MFHLYDRECVESHMFMWLQTLVYQHCLSMSPFYGTIRRTMLKKLNDTNTTVLII